jgi:hypothetical protein
MSYSSNKRKKNRKRFTQSICNTFDEFCLQRGVKAPLIMNKDEYNQEMLYWLSYKRLYELELTEEEKSWVKNNARQEES